MGRRVGRGQRGGGLRGGVVQEVWRYGPLCLGIPRTAGAGKGGYTGDGKRYGNNGYKGSYKDVKGYGAGTYKGGCHKGGVTVEGEGKGWEIGVHEVPERCGEQRGHRGDGRGDLDGGVRSLADRSVGVGGVEPGQEQTQQEG
jgi:hypothetical protein